MVRLLGMFGFSCLGLMEMSKEVVGHWYGWLEGVRLRKRLWRELVEGVVKDV